jgi:hypothetical protein
MTLSIDIQHNSIEFHYAECRYAECCDYLNVMLSVLMLNVVMLSVVMLNVVMVSVVAPFKEIILWRKGSQNNDSQHNGTRQYEFSTRDTQRSIMTFSMTILNITTVGVTIFST